MTAWLLCAVAFLAAQQSTVAAQTGKPVKIIFDTDMDSDCDDLGALAILHALADQGEAEIVATMVSSGNPWSCQCLSVINTYYGRPEIPIGVYKGPLKGKASKYALKMAERFPHALHAAADAPDAVKLYRQLLLKQPDHSVVIVTVGYLSNLANLLKLPAEGKLPSGVDIVKRKVRQWVCMGGNFIGHPARDDLKLGNNNFTEDKPGSLYAVQHWPVKLVFVGREIGSVPSGLKVGSRLRELSADNPIRAGYEYWFGGQAKDRHVADQTTVLYAVRGLRDYWDIEKHGYMDLQPDNTFVWRYGQDRHQYLLKRKVDGQPNDHYIEQTIEELMMRPPQKK